MPGSRYLRFKQRLPGWLRNSLSTLNQAFFARRTLQRKYGPWFDVDWRKHYKTLSNEEWKAAYDTAWRHRMNDCVEEADAGMFLGALGDCRTVLDVGCGIGTLAVTLAKNGYQVSGVDVSAEAIRIAADRARASGVRVDWHEGFAEHLPFPDKSFDCITSAHTIEHVKDLGAVVREFRRVARKSILILTPKQEFKRYMDNYHTQFFGTQEILVNAFGLPRYECREVDCIDHHNEFQGKAWFYAASLES